MLMENKVCVIAGASSLRSIGYATAELFAEHGARIVVTDVNMNPSIEAQIKQSIEQRLGRSVSLLGIACDISDRVQCANLVERTIAAYGNLDCLVNSAGIVRTQKFLDIADTDLDLMLDINLKGAFLLCQSVLKVFVEQRSGCIVNVASAAAQRGGGLVGGGHYAASKGGVISLTRSIAREFGAVGIRANVICPAMIDTPMLDGLTQEKLKEIVEGIPLKRVGSAREMAGACLFLASDLSGFVTGATLDVNGGTHIH